MPTTKRCGTESAVNDAIGGVPNYHYLDFLARGRGQTVRLLWEDAGIAYDDTRYTFDEYPEYKYSRIEPMNPTTSVPVVELNGTILTQSYAILRHFARQLGRYDGETSEEKYWADALCDIVIDWRTLFVQAFFADNKEEAFPEYKKTVRPRFLKALETHLKTNNLSNSGPYVLGKNFTYADIVIYQMCHDDALALEGREALKDYPRLTELVDAVEERPNIKAFMQSDRYLG